MKDLDKETVKRASGEFILQTATALKENIHVYNLCGTIWGPQKRFKNMRKYLYSDLHLFLISRVSFRMQIYLSEIY